MADDDLRPLAEQYADVLSALPESGGYLEESGKRQYDKLAAVDAEMESVLKEITDYLDAVRNLNQAFGYHAALVELAKPEARHGLSAWADGELKEVDATGRFQEVLSKVKAEEDAISGQLRKLQMLLQLRRQLSPPPAYPDQGNRGSPGQDKPGRGPSIAR